MDQREITVLYVEDDVRFADFVVEMLTHLSENIEIEVTPTVEEALDRLHSKEFDCVVSDFEMPGATGLDFLRTVRATWEDLPFVLFTGRGSEEIAVEAIKLGVSDYLQKGADASQFDLLAHRIRNLVEKHRAETQLKRAAQRTEQQFQLLVSTVENYAIFLLDTDGTIQTWNVGAERIKGYTAEEAVGSHFSIFYREPDRAAGVPEQNLDTAAAEGWLTDEGWRVRKDGTEFWADVTIAALREDDELVGFAKITRDSTDRHYEQELLRQNKELRFIVRSISHDLRTPLSVATGRIRLARETRDLSHLGAAIEALERVEELLEYLKGLALTQDEIFTLTSVEFRTAVEAAWRTVETGGAELVVDGDAVLRADERRLRQLLENLFQNAAEHGGRDAQVTVGTLDGDGFYVADTGPGIPAEERERVFELGYSSKPDGTGFGLAISDHLATMHGWRIEATESDDGGARFEITGIEFESPGTDEVEEQAADEGETEDEDE